jgi:hypothetical protein
MAGVTGGCDQNHKAALFHTRADECVRGCMSLLGEAVGLGDGANGDGVVDVEAAGVEGFAVEF